MLNKKSVVAIIPARGGSKGLAGKNVKLLNNKPLISWSIQQCLNSQYVDDVIVTTDSSEIASIALEAGAKVPFIRPGHLATDTALTIDVIEHCHDYLKQSGQIYDYIALIEPTSPLRKNDDIDNMIKNLTKMQTNMIQLFLLVKYKQAHTF